MTTRTKVTSTRVENGQVEIKCYSDPAQGEQYIEAAVIYNVQDLPTPVILDLAAFGFSTVVGNYYRRIQDHPDVPAIATALFEEMRKGDWRPGRRDIGESEPSDLVKALAEATNTPLHVVQHEFDTRMVTRNDGSLYTDASGKPRRFYSKEMQRKIANDPAVAPIIARLEQERSVATLKAVKANKAPSKLATLFDMRSQSPPFDSAAQ